MTNFNTFRRNFAKLLKRWLQTWAPVDIFICGGAVLATVAYVEYKANDLTISNGWVDLWPNFTTEVIGAWISVRVIDFLIKRRGERSQARWRQADILLYWRDRADRIGRYAEERDVHLLSDELRFYEEPHNVVRRIKYLKPSEQAEIEESRKAAETLIAAHANYTSVNEQYETSEYDDPKKKELDAERDQLKTILQQKAALLSEVALKARADILAEEFELE